MRISGPLLIALAASSAEIASAQLPGGGSFGGSEGLASLLSRLRELLSGSSFGSGGFGGFTGGLGGGSAPGGAGSGGIAWPTRPSGGGEGSGGITIPGLGGSSGGITIPGLGGSSGGSSGGSTGGIVIPNDGSNMASPPASSARKSNLYSRGALDQLINQGFKSKVPSAQIVKKEVWTDKIPDTCRQEANKKRISMDKMKVTEVFYADCPESWVFCYAEGTPFTEEALMTEFGRVHVGIRQRVRHVMSFPGGGASWANYLNDISMQFLTYSAILHEAGHGFDDYDTRTAFSISSAWKNAVASDSCVSDSYASVSPAEGWAQTFVLRRYQLEVGDLTKDYSCMKNQLEAVGQQTDALIAAGYSAARKIPRGKIVSKATGAAVTSRRRRDQRLGARAVEEKCAGYLPIEPAVSKA